jgi:MFS family permease
MAASLTLLAGPAIILAWAWRLPFLLGGVFGLVAMVLRRWLAETPVFEAMQAETRIQTGRTQAGLPLGRVLAEHRLAVLLSMCCTWMLTATIVVVILMTPSLLQKLFGLPPGRVQLANLVGSAALCLSAVAVGAATDRFGPRRVGLVVVPLLVVATYALYGSAANATTYLVPAYALAGCGAGLVSLVPVIMVEAFPPPVRFSGLSFSYNLAYAVSGGLTPPLVSWLGSIDRLAPAHYVAAVCVVGLLAIAGMRIAAAPPEFASEAALHQDGTA